MSDRVLGHGIVKCKTSSRQLKRDIYAASHIWKIDMTAILGEKRLRAFWMSQKLEAFQTSNGVKP
eukprot:CAMPEP_0175079374 /NCGR_PEP_ID=MMETSP0052_2-20121109/24779_1 /TAXON_ID=51329 ORGANISM="Polytomella parva, Strain SAG 63-3" /NCGR_SAMPLE_ID=MMETSP0052_2 /ASSEMBLY_ACC=CAM_ASM_000194 /LENGTH=64 /DNA_ID=CAMNT_0016349681 /DNA_START=1357 /DNA_END=1551 /DNA_ORIENTATION=+